MTEQLPTIRTAEKDGDGPVKRPRRPALSCVECRSRKVKCDRGRPCGACTRLGSTTCSYRPKRPGIRERSPTGTSVSPNGSNDQDHVIPARSSHHPSGPSNEFDAMVNRYVAPGIFGDHSKTKHMLLPTNRPSFNLASHTDTGESALISSLLKRVQILESEKEAREGQRDSPDLPIREGPGAPTGQFIKSKFYGQSHWMNALEPYESLGDNNVTVNHNTNRTEINKKSELYKTVTNIKQMARIIKASRFSQPSIAEDVLNSVPPKAVCDILLSGYLRTFEGVFRVLHVPLFRKEYQNYWAGAATEKPSVILKILLVCAIGVSFYSGPDLPLLRASSPKWIQAAAQWLSGPHAKSRLNMAGLQIQVLHLLACQVCNIDGDHIWIPAGSLLRTAMHLGLHRDPSLFGNISVYHCEMRRRLWATVLEITAQSSLDMGMPPMVSVNDYDTKPPSNINDDDFGEGRDIPLNEKQPTEFTDSSIQIAFIQTLPIRLEIIRLINNLRFDLSYEDVLSIGSKLTDACHEQTTFFRSALNAGHRITPFQIKMTDVLVRRFVLCLHRPYFAKARENPKYHYSRKMCLDTSLAIYAPATEHISGQDDDWTKMTHRCVGFFKSFYLYAMSTVYIELNSQIDEHKHTPAVLAPLISNPTTSPPHAFELSSQCRSLRAVLVSALDTALARLRNGETNAKGYVFITCALARIDALVSGADAERAVLDAAKDAVRDTAQILAAVFQAEHGVQIDLKIPSVGNDASRGEGADDVTGQNLQTGTEASVEAGPAMDGAYGSSGGLGVDGGMQGGSTGGLNMLYDGLGGLGGGSEMDMDAYWSGQSLDMDMAGYHFGRSPESFYDLNGWPALENWGMGMQFNAM